jgi:Tfp pilus assembly protein FimT
MKRHFRRIPVSGLSLVEVVVVLSIIAVLGGIFIGTLLATKTGDFIDRGAQQVYDDLIQIRSRSLTANTDHRLYFLSTKTWKLQSWNATSSTWTDLGDVRQMPPDTYLTSATFANAGSNLSATPRGLFSFANSATGSPYVTVTGLGAPKTKSINVFVGGAIELTIP